MMSPIGSERRIAPPHDLGRERGIAEVDGQPSFAEGSARDANRTLRAPRRELWYPPSNAMGRFNEAADPQMALPDRAERPRVLAGLQDSTKWPGIPTS